MIDPDLKPVVSISADGAAFNLDRVLSIEVTDEAGFKSDEVVIELDDADPQIARPREGAKFAVSLGYEGATLTAMGTYVYQEFERSGWPRRMRLTAKAADHAGSLKEPKTRPWEATTLGDVVRTIAAEHGLAPAISEVLGSMAVPYTAQTEESDQNLLTRIARRVGAVIMPKDGRLLVTERYSGKTASGAEMSAVEISARMLLADDAYSFSGSVRGRHKKVRARWRDRAGGATRTVELETGLEGPSNTIREVFQSEAEAQRAAKAEASKVAAGESELQLRLIGTPTIRAEGRIRVSGVSLDVDGDWTVKQVRHLWNYETGGATTEVTAVPIAG